MTEQLDIQRHRGEAGEVAVELAGTLSVESYPLLEAEFRELFGRGPAEFTLSLDGLSELTIVGACGLVGLIRRAQDHGVKLWLVEPREELLGVVRGDGIAAAPALGLCAAVASRPEREPCLRGARSSQSLHDLSIR